jgi:glycerophosphoryl diester phosphodiesterase
MPSLSDVLIRFPDRHFILHIKSNDPNEGEVLGRTLLALPAKERDLLAVTGGDRPIGTLRKTLPGIKTMSPNSIKRCVVRYIAFGGDGLCAGRLPQYGAFCAGECCAMVMGMAR